tara:strand:- start:1602 stop:1979 length:378 start_codon:yes stop_codon:yes gene_type:complete
MNDLTTPNGLSFFNGTPCPIISKDKIPFEKFAMDILKTGLKQYSIKELKKIHYEQMVDMENLLVKICKRDNGLTTDRNIKKWLKLWNNISELKAETLWYTNVYILLKLKVIENDNNNGMVFITTN